MMDGYTELLRQIVECDVLKEKVFDRTHAWLDLIIMARYESDTPGQCIVSNRLLCTRWGWGHTRVSTFLNDLVENGLILLSGTPNGTPNGTANGTLLTLVEYGDSDTCRNTERNGKRNTKRNTEASLNTLYYSNNNIERKEINNTSYYSSPKETEKNDALEAFERIWKKYPNRKSKDHARKAFLKALKEGITAETIEDGVDRYNAWIAATNQDPKYIPHGGTWFFQRRWTDDYTVENSPAKQTKVNRFTDGVMSRNTDYEALFGGNQ